MTINFKTPEIKELQPRLLVMGVGGAGGNALNEMIDNGLQGVEFIAVNTDAQDLKLSKAKGRVQIGLNLTKGLGAGAKLDIGQAAADESLNEIVNILQGANMVFITAGMGGGTGTGAAHVIARAAKELNILTVGVVTLPFLYEGPSRMRRAQQGLEELRKHVDTIIVIPNQNLFKIANEQTTFEDSFNLSNNVLMHGVQSITDLMVRPGLINLDFADVRTVIKEMGFAMMGTATAEGENKAVEASDLALTNPLIENVDMNTAKGVIVNISGGSDMSLMDVDHAANNIRQSVNPDANIIFGSSNDESLVGKLKISIFATGIEESNNKRILTYPQKERENDNSPFSKDENPTTDIDNEKPDKDNQEKITTFYDEPTPQGGFELMPQEIEEKANSTANYDDLQQKKKTGFFGFLNNLMSMDKKEEELRIKSKKNKKNKSKTDPNFLLFGEDDSEKVDADDVSLDNSNISDITTPMTDIENEHDLEIPSYLRKGNV